LVWLLNYIYFIHWRVSILEIAFKNFSLFQIVYKSMSVSPFSTSLNLRKQVLSARLEKGMTMSERTRQIQLINNYRSKETEQMTKVKLSLLSFMYHHINGGRIYIYDTWQLFFRLEVKWKAAIFFTSKSNEGWERHKP
jgi:hypothetical protein